jgi:hypothetical protein
MTHTPTHTHTHFANKLTSQAVGKCVLVVTEDTHRYLGLNVNPNNG